MLFFQLANQRSTSRTWCALASVTRPSTCEKSNRPSSGSISSQ